MLIVVQPEAMVRWHKARWAARLANQREAIAATDFLTVPTITFGVLYCFSSLP